jgi:hypothetical protein
MFELQALGPLSAVPTGALQLNSQETISYDISLVGFQILTAVFMKSSIFWDITPCTPLKVNRRFGGTYRLHLQG